MLWVPKECQIIIRDFIMDKPKCNIWAAMGVGKSSAALSAADIMWLAGSQFHPLLILAPRRVARSVWPGEINKWDHLQGMTVSRILGDPSERIAGLMKEADVYTMNYENVEWLVDIVGKKRWPFKWIIADESTHLKGFRIRHGGKRAAALSIIAKSVQRWVNLTGTPLPNGYQDLWGQAWFLDHGQRLGHSYTAFHDRWFTTDQYTRATTLKSEAGGPEIINLLSDITLSMRAADWFDCDEPVPMPVLFDLPAKAQRIYNDMESELYAELGNNVSVEAMAQAAASIKCAQIASGAVFTDEHGNWTEIHDAKIRMLKEIIDETNGQPLLVGYYFKHDLIRLKKAFPEARELRTEQDEDDWNAGKVAIGLGHPGSIGHGLNLQDGGCIVVFFSQTWNLEWMLQFIQRVGPVRQLQSGHPRPVLVFYIMARNTTDEIMYARTQGKAAVQDAARSMVNRKRAA